MASRWVWRFDGTLQCGFGEEQPLDEARAQLATVIGERNILAGEKRQAPVMLPQVCGAPTGRANAFELTEFGFWLLVPGIIGPIGFRPWEDAPAELMDGGEVPFPFFAKGRDTQAIKKVGFAGVSGSGDPTQIDELFGRECRVYNLGDPLTMDYRPERFNIGLKDGRISELWFG